METAERVLGFKRHGRRSSARQARLGNEPGNSIRSRNDVVPSPAKHHNVRIDGKAHEGLRLSLVAGVVNRRDKITKRNWLFVVRFHHSHLSLLPPAPQA